VSIDPAELERLTDRALSRLPPPTAPRALLPRVMAAVEIAARRPWYARAWRTWPPAWQAASAAAVLVVVAVAALIAPGVYATALDGWALIAEPPAWLEGAARTARAAWEGSRTVWRVLIEPVAGYLAVFVLVMSAACIAFGAALDRVVALGGASES
jgi:hypothetical protein